jgi:hypothetical protein
MVTESLRAAVSGKNQVDEKKLSQVLPTPLTDQSAIDSRWRGFYLVAGITALLVILLIPAEVIISLLPGVEDVTAHTVTPTDWFTLLQNHPFLGLRNLGLLNIVGAFFLVPTMLAIYSLLRRNHPAFAALAAILFFVGVAVYFAGNRGFAVLSLSRQYGSAATDAERSLLAAAGQAMVAEGQSRSGLPLIEFACGLMSAIMLGGTVFSKTTAVAGILGNLLMMVVEFAFTPSHGVGLVVAAAGGLAMMSWYLLVGGRLIQLSRGKRT